MNNDMPLLQGSNSYKKLQSCHYGIGREGKLVLSYKIPNIQMIASYIKSQKLCFVYFKNNSPFICIINT